MNKESLDIVKDKLAEFLDNANIDPIDKIELLINLYYFLSEYDENIKILRKVKDERKDII